MTDIERDIRDHLFIIKEAFTIENGRITSIKSKYIFEYDIDCLKIGNILE